MTLLFTVGSPLDWWVSSLSQNFLASVWPSSVIRFRQSNENILFTVCTSSVVQFCPVMSRWIKIFFSSSVQRPSVVRRSFWWFARFVVLFSAFLCQSYFSVRQCKKSLQPTVLLSFLWHIRLICQSTNGIKYGFDGFVGLVGMVGGEESGKTCQSHNKELSIPENWPST